MSDEESFIVLGSTPTPSMEYYFSSEHYLTPPSAEINETLTQNNSGSSGVQKVDESSRSNHSTGETKSILQEKSMNKNVIGETSSMAASFIEGEMTPSLFQDSPSLVQSEKPTDFGTLDSHQVQCLPDENQTMLSADINEKLSQKNSGSFTLLQVDESFKSNLSTEETKSILRETSRNGTVICEDSSMASSVIKAEVIPSLLQSSRLNNSNISFSDQVQYLFDEDHTKPSVEINKTLTQHNSGSFGLLQEDESLKSNHSTGETTSILQEKTMNEKVIDDEISMTASFTEGEIKPSLLQASTGLMQSTMSTKSDTSASDKGKYLSSGHQTMPSVQSNGTVTQNISSSLLEADGSSMLHHSKRGTKSILQDSSMATSFIKGEMKPSLFQTCTAIRQSEMPTNTDTPTSDQVQQRQSSGLHAMPSVKSNESLSQKSYGSFTLLQADGSSMSNHSIEGTKSILQETSTNGNVVSEDISMATSFIKCDMTPNLFQASPSLVQSTKSINSIASSSDPVQRQSGENKTNPSVQINQSVPPVTDNVQMLLSLMSNISEMNNKYGDQERTINEQRATIETLEGVTKKLNQALDLAEERCQEQADRAEKDKTVLKQQFEESQTQIKVERTYALTVLDELKRELSEKQSMLLNMSKQIEKLLQEKQKLTTINKSHTPDATTATVGDDTITKEQHDKQIKELQQVISVTKSKTIEFDDMKNKYLEELNDLRQNLSESEEKLAKNIQELKTLSEHVDTLATKLDICQIKLEAKRLAHTELSTHQQDGYQPPIVELQLEQNSNIDELTSEKPTKNISVEENIGKLKTLSEQLDILTRNLNIYKTNFEAERSTCSQLASERDRLLSDLKSLQDRNQQLMEKIQHGQTTQDNTTLSDSEEFRSLYTTTASTSGLQKVTIRDSKGKKSFKRQKNNNCSSSIKNSSHKARDTNKLNVKTNMTLNIAKKFYDSTGEQFIKAKKIASRNIKTLNFSAHLSHEGMEVVLHNKGCLMIVDDDFVAEVEIQQPSLLEGAKNYQEAKTIFYSQLRIVQVLLDKRLTKVKQYRKTLLAELESILRQPTDDIENRIAFIELSRIVEKLSTSREQNNINVCREIAQIHFFSTELRRLATINGEEEQKILNETATFQKLGLRYENGSLYLYQNVQKLLTEYAKRYQDVLMKKAPAHLGKLLCTISDEKWILITEADVKLFSDMAGALNEKIFSKPLQDLQHRWIQQIKQVQTGSLYHEFKATNNTYFHLCKSLEEVIMQISEKTGIQESDLLKSNVSRWKSIKQINWKTENLSTQCLERQYNFLFRLLKHFELGTITNRNPFKYEIKLLNSSEIKNKAWSRAKKFAVEKLKAIFGYNDSPSQTSRVPEEILIWYCLLDDALVHVVPKDCDLNVIENTLQSYLKLLHQTNQNQLETLRVATHNTIEFIIQVISHMTTATNDSSIDQRILQQQFAITSSMLSNTSNYRDMVNIFNNYWRFRSEIITEIVSKMPIPEMNDLEQQLLDVVSLALGKFTTNEELLAFFRTFEEFLIDLNEVPFDWFIKSIPNIESMQAVIILGYVTVVDNKCNDTGNTTYRVTDPNNFPAFCRSKGRNVMEPKHYVIAILSELLSFVTSQLQRENWATSESLSTADQLSTTCELISAMHRSFFYLGEQADYASFELFYEESVKPFSSLMENSTSRQDFSTRVHLLKESFWFIRKQNEMDVDTTLQLYEKLNPNIDSELLREPYGEYFDHFKSYMQMTVDEEWSAAATLVANEVRKLISEDMHFSTWDTDFKRHKVPQILAGISSVWSILVSKDVSSTGKYLSPNCVQILCVLRLLSVDIPKSGIDKHLAQVLTGQGKSLVLALVAALIALTGHEVNIGCYSSYLVQRDQNSFCDFYHELGVTSVTYGSLYSLMERIIEPDVDGKKMGLRDLVEDRVLRGKTKQSNKPITSILQNSVLLFDEVDIFFSNKFYGNTYNPVLRLKISGVDRIQEYIWESVCKGNSNVVAILNEVEKLIQSSEFLEMNDFHNFIGNSHVYQIVHFDGTLQSHSNRSLFDKHLKEMIQTAIDVFNSPVTQWADYKLDSCGMILMKVNEEYLNWLRGYNNVFHYFRLKKNNFEKQINGKNNYGYLLIYCGSISYAMLPTNYSLIFGVSGTLEELNEYEAQTIEQLYQIEQKSSMPTFYGNSNLLFDKNTNFVSFPKKTTWRNQIFSQANKGIAANRAVLIFFDDDHELIAFKSEYSGQFDRLNELTENSDDKEKCINESGIAKTITCATRGMGRGVDYKSSVMVEKNGGVHVIQTFFSMDVKEETQIKGRTARQDNKGSYELIVCREDLIRCSLVSKEAADVDISYDKLAEKRNVLSIETNKLISDKIEKNKIYHTTTMDYIKTFFKS